MKRSLIKAYDITLSILREDEAARSSDDYLYFCVMERINPHIAYMPFGEVLLHLDQLGLPPFKSICRARQKVQAKYPELSAADEVELFRADNEEAYKEFVRDIV